MDRQQGFTYLAMIFLVAVAGMILAAIGTTWSSVKAREDAEQLQFVGEQFRQAIGSYYEQSPSGTKYYPRRLEDMLKDDRFAVPKRHLRQIYVNPKTGKTDWDLITAPDGGVMGIKIAATDTFVRLDTRTREIVYRPLGLPTDATQIIRSIR